MTSPARLIVLPSSASATAATLWRVAAGALAVAGFVVVRGCGYDFGTVFSYFGYFVLHVVLPGVVAFSFVNRGPISIAQAIALGVPTGFALEILTFLALAALDFKAAYPWIPAGWVVFGATRRWRHFRRAGWPSELQKVRPRVLGWPARFRGSAGHAGVFLGLCVAFLATVLTAAGQMYAEAPLADGLPTRAIFHDWVYLVSRAVVIKNHWPLDDPSLAGTPLQYHYFMMVHAAAASWRTGIELSEVMLRLLCVPLGAVFVTQAFVLGRAVSRSPWGGVGAALFTVAASELSLSPSYSEPTFLGLFARWLFVSPTFYFGIIFFGALCIAVVRSPRVSPDPRHYIWLLLLGAAGTGAKGTVLPVVIGALGLWILWRWHRERQLPFHAIACGACLIIAFLIVYVPTMSAWRAGDAAWRPFHAFKLSSFWTEYQPVHREWLAARLPHEVAGPIAALACGFVVIAGTCGVRLLAIPYLLWGDRRRRDDRLVGWIAAVAGVSAGIGMTMELNSHGELYVLLLMRMPMAVLAAAFFVSVWRRLGDWLAADGATATNGSAGLLAALRRISWGGRVTAGGALMVLAAALLLQVSAWWMRNSEGLREFLRTPVDLRPDQSMQELREALLWVRDNTEPEAVLVANACTPENMKKDHWGALDRTLTGVHFYYSAISERRLWFEGPNYILDTTRARIRARLASEFFYRRKPLDPGIVSEDPTYVLIDRSLADGAEASLPLGSRVFANARIELHRLSSDGARLTRDSEMVASQTQ